MYKNLDYKKFININKAITETANEILELINRSFKNERKDFEFLKNTIEEANKYTDIEKFEEYKEKYKNYFHRVIEAKKRDLVMLRIMLEEYKEREKKLKKVSLKEEILESVRL